MVKSKSRAPPIRPTSSMSEKSLRESISASMKNNLEKFSLYQNKVKLNLARNHVSYSQTFSKETSKNVEDLENTDEYHNPGEFTFSEPKLEELPSLERTRNQELAQERKINSRAFLKGSTLDLVLSSS